MKPGEFIEESPFRLDMFARRLGIDLPKARSLVQRLVLAGIVSRHQEKQPEDSTDKILHAEDLGDGPSAESRFKFTYVGVLELDGHVIKCYPKFIKDRNPAIEDMRLVLQSVERYKAEHTSLDILSNEPAPRISSQLAMALHLLRDFFTHGLYSNQRDELTLHGQGEIDWETTINTTMPVIHDNRPYYFDYYTRDQRQDDNDYISRLHSCIITECSRKLQECELDAILQLKTPTPYQGERIDFGTDECICTQLRKELNVQFASQKQELLRSLIAWIEGAMANTRASGIQMFGTNSFHTLWEAMCAEVFESQYKQQLSSLGIPLRGEYSDSRDTLESIIAKPLWKAAGGTQAYRASQTLRPDYVRVIEQKSRGSTKCYLVILDAKYYDIELNEKGVKGEPGVEDINKQYLYQLAYNPFSHAHGLVSVNAFVSPTDGETSNMAGSVTMPIFGYLPNAGLQAIKLAKLSANRVMRCYASHMHLFLPQEINELFIEER